jgi:hypothetical protein
MSNNDDNKPSESNVEALIPPRPDIPKRMEEKVAALARHLDILLERLDYTEKSLKLVDQAIEGLRPLGQDDSILIEGAAAYLGEIKRRQLLQNGVTCHWELGGGQVWEWSLVQSQDVRAFVYRFHNVLFYEPGLRPLESAFNRLSFAREGISEPGPKVFSVKTVYE